MNRGRREYHLRRAVGLRMVGVGFVWLAAAVLLEALDRAGGVFGSVPFDALRWLCAVVSALVTVVGLVAALGPWPWLVLDADGFRNRLARPGQARKAAWTEVSDVRGAGGTVLIALADDRKSLVPTVLLNCRTQDVSAEISARLNDAHGYRAAR